jgi:hypothetical protein
VASPERVLVDPEISRTKLEREIEAWRANDADYRTRGWLLLRHEGLSVELAFLGKIPLGNAHVPIVLPTIRLEYENYDLWPPSMTLIDIFTGEPTEPQLTQAFLMTDTGPRQILLRNADGKAFLCVPGTREFHDHPQHSGEPWSLFRSRKMGALAVVAERVSQSMTQTIQGLGMQPVLVQQPPQQVIQMQLPPEIQQALLQAAQQNAA